MLNGSTSESHSLTCGKTKADEASFVLGSLLLKPVPAAPVHMQSVDRLCGLAICCKRSKHLVTKVSIAFRLNDLETSISAAKPARVLETKVSTESRQVVLASVAD